MKRKVLTIKILSVMLLIVSIRMNAQEEGATSKYQVGLDIYSSYIWRGSKFGSGPSFQPGVRYVSGGLDVGVWGAFDVTGYAEADPYISYDFPFGLGIGLTDYYYPSAGGSFFADSSNAYEINAGFSRGGFNISANYILNKASGPGSAGSDLYFQVDCSLKNVTISMGAGDGWHTTDGDFAICHLCIGVSRDIRITDSFSIPVKGQVILNPEQEQLYVVVGFCF